MALNSGTMLRLSLLAATLLMFASSTTAADESPIKSDEVVQFFRTAAWWDAKKNLWQVPIHGWIYQPTDSTVRKKAVATLLRKQYQLAATADTASNFAERVNLLLSDNERGKAITVVLGKHQVQLKSSNANGHFQGYIELDAEEAQQFAQGNTATSETITTADPVVTAKTIVTYKTVARDGREFFGESIVLPQEGMSLISDLDDTIKISDVTDRKQLIDHTFFQNFQPVSGMAQWYRELSAQGVSVHFVSSSPWQLYEPLRRFTEVERFPWATFDLKAVRFRDSTLLNLFKPGTETKPAQIEPLLRRYPQRRFILVGDSGEVDPEVYAGILAKHPQQIAHIFIRNITAESLDNPRFSQLLDAATQHKWTLFTTPPDAGVQ